MRRLRVTFWSSVLVAVVATGVLSNALTARPSAAAGVEVAASGVVLAIAVGLAVRILLAADRRADRS